MLTVRHPITGNWEQIPGVSPPWSQGDQTPTRENNVQDAACPDSAPHVYKWVIYVLLIYLKKTWVCFNCKGWANILKVEQRPLSKSEVLLRSPELPLISETTQGGWVRSSHSKSEIIAHESWLRKGQRAERCWHYTESPCAPALVTVLPMPLYNATKHFPCKKILHIHTDSLRIKLVPKNCEADSASEKSQTKEEQVFICLTGRSQASQSCTYRLFLKQERWGHRQDSGPTTSTPTSNFPDPYTQETA